MAIADNNNKKPANSETSTLEAKEQKPLLSEVKQWIDENGVTRRTFLKASAATAGAAVAVAAILKTDPALLNEVHSQSTPVNDPFGMRSISLNVNGQNYATSVEPRAMLADVLRTNLRLIGTKRPCNRMECGGCTVLIDNVPIYSCQYLAVRAAGKQILTVEGANVDPVIKALEDAWVPADASQCGYCQPGRIMAATALLKKNESPSQGEIIDAISGNLCRCGTYLNVIGAIQAASSNLKGGMP